VRKLARGLRAFARAFARHPRATIIVVTALLIVAVTGVVSAGGAATSNGPSASRFDVRTSSPRPTLDLARRFASRHRRVTVRHSYNNDISRPLRLIRAVPRGPRPEREASPNPTTGRVHVDAPDTVRQKTVAGPQMPSPILNFDGIPFPGVGCNCAPPDTNGEVGLTQYVQIVNQGLQVFNKTTGASVMGPVDIASLWSGFGDPCENDAWGDPVVLYDQLANRWVVSQFAGFDTYGTITDECIAVSRTSDATGEWYRYGFHLGTDFFDYPKLGVWPDGYYMSMNVFNAAGTAYLGPQPFAFERAAMLRGDPASVITTGITGGPSEDPYLPADLDGSAGPPANTPNPFVEFPGNGQYKVYRFHVDWATPANSTFTLAGSPSAAPFTKLCATTPSCVPQLGTSDRLDALADRLMFRAAYRYLGGGTESSLVSNFTVNSSGVAGIRWFELNHLTSGAPAVAQESTYQPDTTWRWMGSIAADHSSDMALGYSASSAAAHPSVRYAGRLASDPANTLGQAESTLLTGGGSQTGTSNRWGDYSDMTVDPVDDCTFWYTQEYYQLTNQFNWRTRIGAFKFPTCTSPTGPNLTIAKTADTPATPGEQIGFIVELVNSGPGNATGIALTDALPSGADVSWTVDAGDSDPGWSVSGSPPNQTVVAPATLNGGSATHVHVVSNTTTNSCGSYDNTASFTAAGGLSGSDSASTTVSCVTITKTADAASAGAGTQIGFTVNLTNISSIVDATGLSVTDPLPSGAGVDWTIQSSDAGWSISGSPPNESLVGPNQLNHGASSQVHVVSNTTAQSCGDYFNTASFTSDAGAGEASADTFVGCPDVEIFKAADDNIVAAGGTIGFYVEMVNFGDAAATGLTFADSLPSGSGVNWLIDGTTGTPGWSISGGPPNQHLGYSGTSLGPGADVWVHIYSGTSAASCATYNNTASFGSGNGGTGSSSDSVTVFGCPPPPPPHAVTVTKGGSGTGTVTSTPAGINCGPVCTAQFSNGTSVTLTAAASPGSRFTGWFGECSGTGTCVLTMSIDHTVSATFAKRPRCRVPKVVGLKLTKAKTKIRSAHCSVGKIAKKFSSRKKKGVVLSQKPKPGKTLLGGSKVSLTVGKGPAR
jgi:uncharacterized repeat protein (TIGR01451 family)